MWRASIPSYLLERESGRLQPRRLHPQLAFEPSSIAAVPLTVNGDPAVPLVLAYCQADAGSRLLAVAGQEGMVSVYDTSSPAGLSTAAMDGALRFRRQHIMCHDNSIFDLAWAKGNTRMHTASASAAVGVWDVQAAACLGCCLGHSSSVKSVSTMHACEDVLASGARDGCIKLWDVRAPGRWDASGQRRSLAAVCTLQAAHAPEPIPASTATGRGSRAKPKPTAAPNITAVAFLPGCQLLASAGSADTCVKFWDVRMPDMPVHVADSPAVVPAAAQGLVGSVGEQAKGKGRASAAAAEAPGNHTRLPSPTAIVPGAGIASLRAAAAGVVAGGGAGTGGHLVASIAYCSRPTRGITHLDVSSYGDKLLVTCTDGSHFILRTLLPEHGPLAAYSVPGVVPSSWYTRSAFSPCGDFFVAGCGAEVDERGEAQGNAYVWQVSSPGAPVMRLAGTAGEVSGVAWCRADPWQLATCGDDRCIRVWGLQRKEQQVLPLHQQAAECKASAAVVAGSAQVAVFAGSARDTGVAPMQQPGASQYAAIAMTAPSAAVHAAAPVQAVTPVAGKENLTCTAPPATKPVASAADTTDLLGKLMQQQLASSSTPGQVRLADKAAGMQGKGSGRKLVQSRLCFGTRSGVTPWTAARPKEDAGLREKHEELGAPGSAHDAEHAEFVNHTAPAAVERLAAGKPSVAASEAALSQAVVHDACTAGAHVSPLRHSTLSVYPMVTIATAIAAPTIATVSVAGPAVDMAAAVGGALNTLTHMDDCPSPPRMQQQQTSIFAHFARVGSASPRPAQRAPPSNSSLGGSGGSLQHGPNVLRPRSRLGLGGSSDATNGAGALPPGLVSPLVCGHASAPTGQSFASGQSFSQSPLGRSQPQGIVHTLKGCSASRVESLTASPAAVKGTAVIKSPRTRGFGVNSVGTPSVSDSSSGSECQHNQSVVNLRHGSDAQAVSVSASTHWQKLNPGVGISISMGQGPPSPTAHPPQHTVNDPWVNTAAEDDFLECPFAELPIDGTPVGPALDSGLVPTILPDPFRSFRPSFSGGRAGSFGQGLGNSPSRLGPRHSLGVLTHGSGAGQEAEGADSHGWVLAGSSSGQHHHLGSGGGSPRDIGTGYSPRGTDASALSPLHGSPRTAPGQTQVPGLPAADVHAFQLLLQQQPLRVLGSSVLEGEAELATDMHSTAADQFRSNNQRQVGLATPGDDSIHQDGSMHGLLLHGPMQSFNYNVAQGEELAHEEEDPYGMEMEYVEDPFADKENLPPGSLPAQAIRVSLPMHPEAPAASPAGLNATASAEAAMLDATAAATATAPGDTFTVRLFTTGTELAQDGQTTESAVGPAFAAAAAGVGAQAPAQAVALVLPADLLGIMHWPSTADSVPTPAPGSAITMVQAVSMDLTADAADAMQLDAVHAAQHGPAGKAATSSAVPLSSCGASAPHAGQDANPVHASAQGLVGIIPCVAFDLGHSPEDDGEKEGDCHLGPNGTPAKRARVIAPSACSAEGHGQLSAASTAVAGSAAAKGGLSFPASKDDALMKASDERAMPPPCNKALQRASKQTTHHQQRGQPHQQEQELLQHCAPAMLSSHHTHGVTIGSSWMQRRGASVDSLPLLMANTWAGDSAAVSATTGRLLLDNSNDFPALHASPFIGGQAPVLDGSVCAIAPVPQAEQQQQQQQQQNCGTRGQQAAATQGHGLETARVLSFGAKRTAAACQQWQQKQLPAESAAEDPQCNMWMYQNAQELAQAAAEMAAAIPHLSSLMPPPSAAAAAEASSPPKQGWAAPAHGSHVQVQLHGSGVSGCLAAASKLAAVAAAAAGGAAPPGICKETACCQAEVLMPISSRIPAHGSLTPPLHSLTLCAFGPSLDLQHPLSNGSLAAHAQGMPGHLARSTSVHIGTEPGPSAGMFKSLSIKKASSATGFAGAGVGCLRSPPGKRAYSEMVGHFSGSGEGMAGTQLQQHGLASCVASPGAQGSITRHAQQASAFVHSSHGLSSPPPALSPSIRTAPSKVKRPASLSIAQRTGLLEAGQEGEEEFGGFAIAARQLHWLPDHTAQA